MFRSKKSLLQTVQSRLKIRKTKSDQFIEVSNLPVKEVILQMDDFFNQMDLVVALYKKMRTEVLKTKTTKLLAEMDKCKKGFVRAVSLVRAFNRLVPKFDHKNNIKLAHEMYKMGYIQEAEDMCLELGVEYSDFFTPKKKKEKIPIRKRPLISQKIIAILEKNKPTLVIHEGERKKYFLFVDRDSKFIVHDKYLSKNVWASTHVFKCVEVPPKNAITFNPRRPRIGQFVKSKDGKSLQIVWLIMKKDIGFYKEKRAINFAKAKYELVQVKKREEALLKRAEERKKLSAIRKKERGKEFEKKRKELSRIKRIETAVELRKQRIMEKYSLTPVRKIHKPTE